MYFTNDFQYMIYISFSDVKNKHLSQNSFNYYFSGLYNIIDILLVAIINLLII